MKKDEILSRIEKAIGYVILERPLSDEERVRFIEQVIKNLTKKKNTNEEIDS